MSGFRLAAAPGKVFVPGGASGLPRDFAVNVTALVTQATDELTGAVGQVPVALVRAVDSGCGLLADSGHSPD